MFLQAEKPHLEELFAEAYRVCAHELLQANLAVSARNLVVIQLNMSSANYWHVWERYKEFSNKQLHSLVEMIPSRWISTCESFHKIILFLSYPQQSATMKINIQKDNALQFFSSQVTEGHIYTVND